MWSTLSVLSGLSCLGGPDLHSGFKRRGRSASAPNLIGWRNRGQEPHEQVSRMSKSYEQSAKRAVSHQRARHTGAPWSRIRPAALRRPGRRGRDPSVRPATPGSKRRDGPVEALQGQGGDRGGIDPRLDHAEHPLADDDLSARRLVAQAGSEIGDAADRCVFEASVEADLPERGIAHRDADPEPERMAAVAPAFGQLADAVAHLHRHPDRALGVIGIGDRIVEQGQMPSPANRSSVPS